MTVAHKRRDIAEEDKMKADSQFVKVDDVIFIHDESAYAWNLSANRDGYICLSKINFDSIVPREDIAHLVSN